ncbi:MAG: MraZ N-terminal domain containing protein, partial [Spirochaetia bacterium]|nr:MraZ N-terminal domain containing protein [Spirochaetia bacterium]
MLTGEYKNTIDEKGRILIPSRLRSSIAGNTLIVTRSIEKNLWMMLPEMWTKV